MAFPRDETMLSSKSDDGKAKEVLSEPVLVDCHIYRILFSIYEMIGLWALYGQSAGS